MRIQSVSASARIMTTFVSSEFNIFAAKPVQESVLETTEVVHKPIASIDQSDLEFLISADNETSISISSCTSVGN
jgi:hypothetical protein